MVLSMKGGVELFTCVHPGRECICAGSATVEQAITSPSKGSEKCNEENNKPRGA